MLISTLTILALIVWFWVIPARLLGTDENNTLKKFFTVLLTLLLIIISYSKNPNGYSYLTNVNSDNRSVVYKHYSYKDIDAYDPGNDYENHFNPSPSRYYEDESYDYYDDEENYGDHVGAEHDNDPVFTRETAEWVIGQYGKNRSN